MSAPLIYCCNVWRGSLFLCYVFGRRESVEPFQLYLIPKKDKIVGYYKDQILFEVGYDGSVSSDDRTQFVYPSTLRQLLTEDENLGEIDDICIDLHSLSTIDPIFLGLTDEVKFLKLLSSGVFDDEE